MNTQQENMPTATMAPSGPVVPSATATPEFSDESTFLIVTCQPQPSGGAGGGKPSGNLTGMGTDQAKRAPGVDPETGGAFHKGAADGRSGGADGVPTGAVADHSGTVGDSVGPCQRRNGSAILINLHSGVFI